MSLEELQGSDLLWPSEFWTKKRHDVAYISKGSLWLAIQINYKRTNMGAGRLQEIIAVI